MVDLAEDVVTKTGPRLDHQIKLILAAMLFAVFGVGSFLAIQVWDMNGKMAGFEKSLQAQQRGQERIERALEKLTDEFRKYKDRDK